ncbi:UPF0236 family protein [[Mycoplasma] cavipharyngis]|uniref:UPF0236 family transposase-like protein n=1 Tax=[Mycoplasma] cavipharyngis TaxID=92757 RepID=UPI0037040157
MFNNLIFNRETKLKIVQLMRNLWNKYFNNLELKRKIFSRLKKINKSKPKNNLEPELNTNDYVSWQYELVDDFLYWLIRSELKIKLRFKEYVSKKIWSDEFNKEVLVRRRKYTFLNLETNKEEDFYPFDEVLEIQKNLSFNKSSLKKFYQKYIKLKSTYEFLANFYQISKTRFARLLKHIYQKRYHKKDDQLSSKNKIDLTNCPFLYIETDDTFLKLANQNSKNKTLLRLFVFHTGYNNNDSKSKKITNERSLLLIKKNDFDNNMDLKTMLKNFLDDNYTNRENCQIIINCDGAQWMKKLTKELNATIIYDKFHLQRNINNFFLNRISWAKFEQLEDFEKNQEPIKRKLLKYFLRKKLDDLIKSKNLIKLKRKECDQFIEQWIEEFNQILATQNLKNILIDIDSPIIINLKKAINFIFNNKSGINNLYHLPQSIGCRIEAFIANKIKNPLKNRVFKIENFINLVNQNFKKIVCI